MDKAVIISLISSLLGGLVVAAANYFFTRKRESIRQKNEVRVSYLIESWKKIERASNIDGASPEQKYKLYDELEDALASIGLLGTGEAADLGHKMSEGPGADSTKLLHALRNSLRKELGLEPLNEKQLFIRMKRASQL